MVVGLVGGELECGGGGGIIVGLVGGELECGGGGGIIVGLVGGELERGGGGGIEVLLVVVKCYGYDTCDGRFVVVWMVWLSEWGGWNTLVHELGGVGGECRRTLGMSGESRTSCTIRRVVSGL